MTEYEFDYITVLTAHIVIGSGFLIVFGFFGVPFVAFLHGVTDMTLIEPMQRLYIAFGSVFMIIGVPWFLISLFASIAERVFNFFITPPKTVPDKQPKLTGGVP